MVSTRAALILFTVLVVLAFILVLFTNRLTILLAFGALILASAYPFMKRYTHLPQVVCRLCVVRTDGQRFELGMIYSLSILVATGLFVYQQHLIKDRDRAACFKAFTNNHYVGLVIFLGIALDYAFIGKI